MQTNESELKSIKSAKTFVEYVENIVQVDRNEVPDSSVVDNFTRTLVGAFQPPLKSGIMETMGFFLPAYSGKKRIFLL